LAALDTFVVDEIKDKLSDSKAVNIFNDGWRDRKRRNWLDLGVSLLQDSDAGLEEPWEFQVYDLDMIPVPSSSTGDNIETLLKESLDFFLPEDCVIATSTSDGGSDERKAASQLVKEGNDWWCSAHLVQLCVHDSLDPKKANAPASCAPHRELIAKAHAFVVFVNGHKDVLRAFQQLAADHNKDSAINWEVLVLDNDTRWDTWLYLLERIVYFDPVWVELYRMVQLNFPPDLIFSEAELSLGYAMVLVLEPIREFTKFVQNRTSITLAYVPEKIDALVTKLAPGAFDEQLRQCSQEVRDLANTLQSELVASIEKRFEHIYLGGSIALAAASLLPGPNRTSFANFEVTDAAREEVDENIVDDVASMLPSTTPEDEVDLHKVTARAQLQLLRKRLVRLDPAVDPLAWYPKQRDLAPLHPAIKCYLSAQGSSADSERAFSSASFTLDIHRYRMDIETFRKEHRLRRYLVSGAPIHTKQGRELRESRLQKLINRYDDFLATEIAEERQ